MIGGVFMRSKKRLAALLLGFSVSIVTVAATPAYAAVWEKMANGGVVRINREGGQSVEISLK